MSKAAKTRVVVLSPVEYLQRMQAHPFDQSGIRMTSHMCEGSAQFSGDRHRSLWPPAASAGVCNYNPAYPGPCGAKTHPTDGKTWFEYECSYGHVFGMRAHEALASASCPYCCVTDPESVAKPRGSPAVHLSPGRNDMSKNKAARWDPVGKILWQPVESGDLPGKPAGWAGCGKVHYDHITWPPFVRADGGSHYVGWELSYKRAREQKS